MKKSFSLLVFSLALIIGCVGAQEGDRTPKLVSVQEAHRMIERDTSVLLLDVRTAAEFQGGRLAGAILIPVQQLEVRIEELRPYKDKTILVYCRTGNRSRLAAEILAKNGFKVFKMAGGIVKWSESNLPVVRENQIRNESR